MSNCCFGATAFKLVGTLYDPVRGNKERANLTSSFISMCVSSKYGAHLSTLAHCRPDMIAAQRI